MTSRFSAAARAAILETLSPSSEPWRNDVRLSPRIIDRSPSLPHSERYSTAVPIPQFDDNPADDDTAISESAYDGAIRRAMDAVNSSDTDVLKGRIDSYLAEVARQSSPYSSPQQIAPARTDAFQHMDDTPPAGQSPGSASRHLMSAGRASQPASSPLGRVASPLMPSLTPSRSMAATAHQARPHATPSTPSTARAVGRADAALAAAAVQSRLSSPSSSIPSPRTPRHTTPLGQSRAGAGMGSSARRTAHERLSPHRTPEKALGSSMDRPYAQAGPSSDPHSLVRAAEALYIAHADWRRAGIGREGQGPEHEEGGARNPYLHADYAYERVGWPSSPSLTSASLERIGGRGAGSAARAGAHMQGHASASSPALETALAFCHELGIDAHDPGSGSAVVEKCSALQRAAILAASLDAFAASVCDTLSTQAVGLVEVPLPSGAVSYRSARGVSDPSVRPARVGLSQAVTLLRACMEELQQLRRAQAASSRLQEIHERHSGRA